MPCFSASNNVPPPFDGTLVEMIRFRALLIAACVTELITRIKVPLPSSYPYKQSVVRFTGRALALPP